MSDKQLLYGVSALLVVIWGAFYIGGMVLPDGWFGRWYTLPFIVTCFVACVGAFIGGCILGEEKE